MTIDVELYRDQLERLLATLDEGEWVLRTVPSVEEWAKSVNRSLRRVFVPALVATDNHGRRIVVIRRFLTDEIQSNVRNGFLMRGLDDEGLEDPVYFLEHLVVHEAAHHVLDSQDENACDAWASSKISRR